MTKVVELAKIHIEDYGTGPTVCVTVRESITTPRGLAIVDERDVLFFGEEGPGDAAQPMEIPTSHSLRRDYESNPVMIFACPPAGSIRTASITTGTTRLGWKAAPGCLCPAA